MESGKRHVVIATAGHIDHGKTALVRALTGMETDRLEEEKRRGITIELGFAFLGDDISIIDVPGHERFIKTMVAGVTTVDLAILVVAADDGVMPQTREHLAILNLLAVPNLLVAITKISTQDDDWVDIVEEELLDTMPVRYRERVPIFRCDSLDGKGIDELRSAIIDFAEKAATHKPGRIFRLPVDRAFVLKGHGTVVTGTILEGTVSIGDRLQVLPVDSEIRVRGLQCHGSDRQEMRAGERAALNIIGSDLGRIKRGHWICQKNFYTVTDLIDLEIETIDDAPILKNRDRVRLHIGTDEVIGRLILFGKDKLEPGTKGFAQFIAEKPFLAIRDDRIILRRYSPLQTYGGGRILDPLPERKRRSHEGALSAFKILAESSGSEALMHKIQICGSHGFSMAAARTFTNLPQDELISMVEDLIGEDRVKLAGTLKEGMLITYNVYSELKHKIVAALKAYHAEHPQTLGLKSTSLVANLSTAYPSEIIETAIEDLLDRDVVLEKGFLRRIDHIIHLDEKTEELCNRIENCLRNAGFTPPDQGTLRKQLKLSEADLNRGLSIMTQQGRIARMADGTPWSAENVLLAWEKIQPLLAAGEGIRMSELREALDCPRRHVMNLIEYFDGLGLTERREDLRYPGPNFDKKLF
jgi:selenocysteine-specific elongation factor